MSPSAPISQLSWLVRRRLRVLMALVAIVGLLSGGLTAVLTEAASASSDIVIQGTETPPDLINDLNLLGTVQPSPGEPPEQAPSQQYVATATQQTALSDLEQQAIANTIQDHGLAASDSAAVESWGRDDAISELWALLVQAIDTPAAQQTPDQQNAVAWLANAVEYQNIQAADDAGLEYAKWAGLGASEFEAQLGDPSGLQAFLSQPPLTYGPDETSLVPDVSGPEGYCNYTPPAPDQSQYTSGASGSTPSPNCFSDCTSILGCPVPTPTYDQFVQWGAVDADSEDDSSSAMAVAADVAEAVGFASSAVAGTVAGVALSSALPGVLVNSSVAAALSPFSAVQGAALAAAGDASAASEFAAVAAADIAGAVGIILVAIATAVIEGISVVDADQLPGQLAGLIAGASTTPDLATMLQNTDQAEEVYEVFVGSTLPIPTATTCDNTGSYQGSGEGSGYPVEPPCLNAPAIPAAYSGDPQFSVTEKGSSTSTQEPSITWADAATGTTDTAYVAYSNWWAETSTLDGSSLTVQTLRIQYTDWEGDEREAWLVGNGAGGYTFVTAELGSGQDFDPATCASSGACTTSTSIDYVGTDGNDYSASLPAPSVPPVPPAPSSPFQQVATSIDLTTSPAQLEVGEPVTFTALVRGSPIASGTVSFVDDYGGVLTTLCPSAAVNVVQTSSTTTGNTTVSTYAPEATCTATMASSGTQQIYATYSGDDLDLPSQGVLTVQVTTQSPTVTTVTVAPTTPALGQQATFTATVSSFYGTTTPSGTVDFSGDGVDCASALVVTAAGDAATCAAVITVPGDLTVSATYSGDADDSGSSGAVTVAVDSAVTVDVTGSQTYGSSSPSFSYTDNVPSGVSLSGTLTCTTLDGEAVPVGPAFPAGSYTIDGSGCSGLQASVPGYTISYTGGTFTVNPAPVTVTVSGSQLYGSSSPVFTYTDNAPGGVSVSGTVSCSSAGPAITPTLPAGPYQIWGPSCSGLSLSDANYTINYQGGIFDVTPVTVSVVVSGSQTYKGTSPVFSYVDNAPAGVNLSGQVFCADMTLDGETSELSPTLAAGTYTVDAASCLGLQPSNSRNYTLAYVGGTFTVAPVTITVSVSGSQTYGSANPTFEYAGNAPAGVTLTGAASCATADDGADTIGPDLTATSYTLDGLSCSGLTPSDPTDYTVSYVGGSFVVNQAPLTVEVSGFQTFGSSSPVFSYTANLPSGVSVSGAVTCTTVNGGADSIEAALSANTYTVDGSSCSGLTLSGSNDYSLSYVGGTFTVTPAPISVDVTGWQTYGSSSPTLTYTASTLGEVTGTVTCTTVNIAADQISPSLPAGGTYTIDGSGCSGLTLSDPIDYTLSYAGGAFTVAPAPTTVVLAGTPATSVTLGEAVTYMASVSTSSPGGTLAGAVSFTRNGTAIGGCPDVALAGGAATCRTAFSKVGSYSVVATYADSPDFATSSGSVTQVVVQPQATQPAGTQPAGTQPAGTETAGTQPAGTQPGTTPSSTNEPPVTSVADQGPAILSGHRARATAGDAFSYQVVARGYPAPTFSVAGALPKGISLSLSGVLSGVPVAGTGGSYPIKITATNSAGSATESFTLTVDQTPAITSRSGATALTSERFSFQVTASGYPAPRFARDGAMPHGLSLSGSGLLSGTLGAAGTYTFTLKAMNASGMARQRFALKVSANA